jgi:predicted nucleic acid-binding protein
VSIIVSNASPLINLARIQRFELLRLFYGELTIPPAVYDEVVTRGSERDGSRNVRESIWIRQQSPHDQLAVTALAAELDWGEASAIILARELNADTLLIDEIRGRRIAQRLGITVKGTIGILTRAKREGLIPNVKDELDRLRQRGTWIHPRLYQDILRMAGEMP